jgi:ATP-dependent RNA helicase DHX33
VRGRQHPVQILYTSAGQTDYVEASLRTFFQVHIDQPAGDVLIFLPGLLPSNSVMLLWANKISTGQEDIESLHTSILQFASQLPLGCLMVGSFSYSYITV